MSPYVTYAIGVPLSGYPVQKTQKQLQKLAQQLQKIAETVAVLQDGYEVYARPASQQCPVHTAMEIAGHSQECRCALESRPLF